MQVYHRQLRQGRRARAPANADLHAVLGVLYNLSRDYPAAVGAFEAALQLRPTDYSLWNKLGATQANSMECSKALPCYINALDRKRIPDLDTAERSYLV